MISAPTQGSSSTDTLRSRSERAAADEFRPRAHAACPLTSGAGSERASTSRVTASDRGSSCPASQFPSATQTLRANPTRPARRIARERLPAFLGECHAKEVDQDGASVPGWTERPPGSRGVSAEPPTFANLPPVVPLSEPGPAGPIASTPTGRSPAPPGHVARLGRLLGELHVERAHLLGLLPIHPFSFQAHNWPQHQGIGAATRPLQRRGRDSNPVRGGPTGGRA